MLSLKAIALFPYYLARYKPLRGNWFAPYLRARLRRRKVSDSFVDVVVLLVDHFEPASKFGEAAAVESVQQWCKAYTRQIDGIYDSSGRKPQHTWFYRAEYPNLGCIHELSKYCFEQFGEIEFHLHHGFDTNESFREKLRQGLNFFNRYGAMLTCEASPQQRFSYIAGNWSLDNGSFDESLSGCNNELAALREMGCYCDFTFPAIGSRAQPRITNSIYYATDDPRPKSYDTGTPVLVGGIPIGDLMIFQGPCGFNWRRCWFEDAAVESYSPPELGRLQAWIAPHIHVTGRPEWIFVKLHCHGMQSKKLYGDPKIRRMFEWMLEEWNRDKFRLHFVTAREAYNIVKAAEQGKSGNPADYVEHEVPKPANRLIYCSSPWRLLEHSMSYTRVEIDPMPGTQFKIAGCEIDSFDGTLRHIEIQRTGSCFARIKVLADSDVTASRGNTLSTLPVGHWCNFDQIGRSVVRPEY